jgi:hypothetical protein
MTFMLCRAHLPAMVGAVVLVLGASRVASAQDAPGTLALVVKSARPIHVELDQRVSIKRVGQPLSGVITEPVYVYDRIVIPAGTRVLGHVTSLAPAAKGVRAQAMLNGDFSPDRTVGIEFDTLVLDLRSMPMKTLVTAGIERVQRMVAGGTEPKTGAGGRIQDEIHRKEAELKQQGRDAITAIKQPGKIGRLKDMALHRLPIHPQVFPKGMVFRAELAAPLDFGTVTPAPAAPPGTVPPPGSILTARLVTPVDSAKSTRGTPIVAVLTEPVMSPAGQVILPEGTELRGSVTFATEARHFHRNGKLRFLFEQVVNPREEQPESLQASLYSVQADGGAGVRLDEEGGAVVQNSKTRFIAPGLAVFALSVAADPGQGAEGPAEVGDTGANYGTSAGRGLGGFYGLGLAGAALSQFSRPVAIGLAAYGAVRTVYSAVFGKGREVAFTADTPIQVQLAPGPTLAR